MRFLFVVETGFHYVDLTDHNSTLAFAGIKELKAPNNVPLLILVFETGSHLIAQASLAFSSNPFSLLSVGIIRASIYCSK